MKCTHLVPLLFLLLCTVPNNAKIIYVRNGSGSSPGSCGLTTEDACPTIQSGISNAASGDIISISAAGGNYNGSGNTQISITKDLTLVGESGMSIDGQNSNTIFDIADRINHITFDTIEFWRGFPAISISNSGPITFRNCKFTNNNLDNDGGAVNIDGGQVTFDSCTFISNTASGSSDGGAVYAVDTTAEFSNCTFQSNYATRRGGAVKLSSLSFGYFYSCNFTSNNADNNGGAISTESINTNGELVVEGCIFKSNTGSRGGAIDLSASNSVHIWGSSFTSNIANNGDGGALSISGTPINTPDIVSSVFTSNQAINSGSSSGGAISSVTALLITDSIFTMNSADIFSFGSNKGGGAILTSKTLTVDRCVFDSNSVPAAGGAIYASTGPLVLTNSVFTGNNVKVSGGAVYVLSSLTTTVRNCSFTGNYATGLDAGAFFATSSLFVSDSIFRNNTAADSGGAVVVASSSSANFSNVLFDKNTAWGVGGGLFCSSSAVDMLLSNVNFTSNTAMQKGGGLKTDCATTLVNTFFNFNFGGIGGGLYSGGPVSVSNAEFSLNSALTGGAIGAASNGEVLYIVDTYIVSNYGYNSTGGIYASSSVSVDNSYFWNNTASGPGGALRLLTSTTASLTLTECSFSNNSATVGGGVLLENSATVNIINCDLTKSSPEDVRVRLNEDGKTHSISGMSTHIDELYVEYGSISLDSNFAVGIVTLDGQGIIGGIGNATISSDFEINGSLTGIGYLTAADGSLVSVTGSGQHLLDKPFINKGHFYLPANSSCLTFANNSTLYNQLYGKIYLECNLTIGSGMISNEASILPTNNVQISQRYYESPSSSIIFYLRSTNNDRIDFTSDVNLQGAVRLEPVTPYAPNISTIVTLITSANKNISGQFQYRISSNFTFTIQTGLQQINATIINGGPLVYAPCTSNSQCRTNSNCDASCVTGYCLGGSLLCSGSQTCNVDEGYCGQCNSHDDCRTNQNCDSLCVLGTCQLGSLSCNVPQLCNITSGTCYAGPNTTSTSPSPSTTNQADNTSSNNVASNTNTLIGVIVGVGAAIILTVIISTIILKMKTSGRSNEDAEPMANF